MTAAINEDSVVSDITLTFLEETGWYKVNFNYAEELEWGKGKGCKFVTGKCIENNKAVFEEFCDNKNGWGCSYIGTYKAICSVS